MAKLDASLETISGSMAKAEYYHKFYEETFEKTTLYSEDTTKNLGKILASALPEFYCAVLVFAVKAKGYFAPSNWRPLPPRELVRSNAHRVSRKVYQPNQAIWCCSSAIARRDQGEGSCSERSSRNGPNEADKRNR
jgi:hypothetical protein